MSDVMRWLPNIQSHMYLDADGLPRWAVDGYNGRYKKGDLVQFFQGTRYLCLQVPKARATIRAHHVVLLLAGVTIPEHLSVDHIDGDRLNNKLSNLRLVTHRQNCCNKKKHSNNTSGHTGIRWSDYHQHFVIRRTISGKRLSTSRNTLEEALAVMNEFTQQDSDYTERHGK